MRDRKTNGAKIRGVEGAEKRREEVKILQGYV